LGGASAARDPVVGRGGVGITGSRYSLSLSLCRAAFAACLALPRSLRCERKSPRTDRRDRRLLIAERDPDVDVVLRLPFDEPIPGLVPEQDLLVLVVEDEFALVALHRQHRMAVAALVAHHRDEQRFARPAGVSKHLALLQDIVLAVAIAVGRIRP